MAGRRTRGPVHRQVLRPLRDGAEAGAEARLPAGWRGGPSPPIIAEELAELAQRLLHDPELSPRDRIASVLVAVFAQPVSRVARLPADDVALNGESVAIRFGDTAVSIPDPIADDLRVLIADTAEQLPPKTRRALWLFPGSARGRPIGEHVLSRRMKRIGVECSDARLDRVA